MRGARPIVITLLAAAAIVTAGCGGNNVKADEVNVPPPVLTIPKGDTSSLASGTATATATATETPTPAAGTTGTSTGSQTGTAAPSTGQTGGTTPSTGGTTTSPGTTGGAGADQQFQTFCAQNPGACPKQP